MLSRIRRIVKQTVCVYKGHVLPLDPELRCYVRDGSRFVYHGRFFRCERCERLIRVTGLMQRELTELIRTTLEDLPPLDWERVLSENCVFEFLNIYIERKEDALRTKEQRPDQV